MSRRSLIPQRPETTDDKHQPEASGPLLLPISKAVGIHEMHCAMVVLPSTGLGLFAPLFEIGYCAAWASGRFVPDAGIRPITDHMAELFIGLVIVAAMPWISIDFL